MAKKTDPLLSRALLDTSLQLGPQENALHTLLSQLADQYSRTRSVNAGNARGIKQSTVDAQPGVARAFDTALSSVSAQRAALGQGGTADPQAAAYERRVGEQKASAITDLIQQGVRADTGRVYANQQARSDYEGGKARILSDLQSLMGQEGAQTASTYGKLRDDQAQRRLTARGQDVTAANASGSRAQSERNSVRSSGIDPDTGKPIPGGRLDPRAKKPKGPKLATAEQHSKARDAIERGIAAVKDLRGHGTTDRASLVQLLIQGIPAVKSDKGELLAPAIPALSADFARAAVNVAMLGGLSQQDVARLHNRRLSVKRLGYRTRKSGAKPPRTKTQTAEDLLTGASQGAVGGG